MFRETFEVDEENDSSESEDERNENFVRSPFVSDSSPGQTENGRSRCGDEDQVTVDRVRSG